MPVNSFCPMNFTICSIIVTCKNLWSSHLCSQHVPQVSDHKRIYSKSEKSKNECMSLAWRSSTLVAYELHWASPTEWSLRMGNCYSLTEISKAQNHHRQVQLNHGEFNPEFQCCFSHLSQSELLTL